MNVLIMNNLNNPLGQIANAITQVGYLPILIKLNPT